MLSEPATFRAVTVSSPFYLELSERTRTVTLPTIIDSLKRTGRFYALSWTPETALKRTHPFWDSDVYKTMEACCYFLMNHHDAQLRTDVEEIVGYIKNAQWGDGYINSYFTLHEPNNRFTNLRDKHELYCFGHLAEFAAAYFGLTGSQDLIDAVRRMLDLVRSVIFPKGGYPGHEELELALMRLYDITKEQSLLEAAGYLVRERGSKDKNGDSYFDREARARGEDPLDFFGNDSRATLGIPGGYAYMQAHAPLLEQCSIEGHCVRAMYFLTGAAHYALNDPACSHGVHDAVQLLFDNTVRQKMYITGGIGSIREFEGFGPNYRLPDLQIDGCYSESCASIGLIMLCERLLRHSLKGVYGDVIERAFFNCILGAISANGREFYYENPLRTKSGKIWARSTWFDTACCPPNIAKIIGLLPSYIYSIKDGLIAIHLFISSKFTAAIDGEQVTIQMDTGLPWIGNVKIEVVSPRRINIAIRIPAWGARTFKSSVPGEARDGYFYFSAISSSIKFEFSVTPKLVHAHPYCDKSEVAVVRGPLVYCAESPDNNFSLENIYVDIMQPVYEIGIQQIAGIPGVPFLEVQAEQRTIPRDNTQLYYDEIPPMTVEKKNLKLLPYFLRANRCGDGSMRVWLKKVPR
ncbi:glycoside hydrolase family 127 protein [Acidomyces richmondensis BFW]|nr:MAG: glycoside hydrolase family 127 protein [Acidomyces sp. 'richmondensis']KYG49725.1 glycoside hydrolase family 127 protein [Acidomyces richmondensis BFW]